MDTLDGSYLKTGSPRRQTRSTTTTMPPPSQPRLVQVSSSSSSPPNNASNMSLFSPTTTNDTLNSSTSSKLCSTRIVTSNAADLDPYDPSIMSYQRVRKVVSSSFSAVDAELRAKEEHLAHLRSIDVSKYASPNETKPKTDYTYANTSSYRTNTLTSSGDHGDEVMPNLCRRSRRSPAYGDSSSFSLSSTSNYISTSLYSFSPSKLLRNAGSTGTQTVAASLGLLNSSLNSVRSYFSSVSVFGNRSHAELTGQQLINVKNLNRRLAFELSEQKAKMIDDDMASKPPPLPNRQPPPRETRASSALKKFAFLGNLYGLDRDSPPPSVVPSSQQAPKSSKLPGGVNVGARTSAAADANLPNLDDRRSSPAREGAAIRSSNVTVTTITEELRQPPPPSPPHEQRRPKRDGCLSGLCWWLPLLLLLLLAVPIGYKLLQNNDDQIKSSQYYQTVARAYHEYVEPAWRSVRSYGDSAVAWVGNLNASIWSWLACWFRCPTPSSPDPSTLVVPGKLTEEELNRIKEGILDELKKKFPLQKDADLEDRVLQELNLKFNKTLDVLKQQTSQFETSKQTTMDEINQMKGVLSELQRRHLELLKELGEQKSQGTVQAEQLKKASEAARIAQETAEKAQQIVQAQADIISNQQQAAAAVDHSSHQQQQHFGLDKNVTFREIEEYINRTFYLYNADKTGKTDFASESVGGSVLFTRCTETYMEGARWFTVFDVPITRITVSPRVVIQGTIQPGNCWAFKGSKADLFIRLAARIRPTSFSIEHIPKELSITGNIDSAPQNFTIYGYTNKEEISDDKRLLLGSYRYDNNSKSPLQFFDALHHYDVPIGVIELKIESNAGNKDYTCLYKFRVHGELFKLANGGGAKTIENAQNDDPAIAKENAASSSSSTANVHN